MQDDQGCCKWVVDLVPGPPVYTQDEHGNTTISRKIERKRCGKKLS